MSKFRLWQPVVIDFSTTIAAGANATQTTKIDAASPFFVQSIECIVWSPATFLTTSIAGTPYVNPDSTSSPAANTGNSGPTLAHFRLQINVAALDWFTSPARIPLVCGDGRLPGYLGVLRTIGVGHDIRATLYNDCAATFTAQAQLILKGYKLVDGAQPGAVPMQ